MRQKPWQLSDLKERQREVLVDVRLRLGGTTSVVRT
jgi:hypothetical protein